MASDRTATFYDPLIRSRLRRVFFDDTDFLNFGYWTPETTDQKQACEQLVERLLGFIPQKAGTILDVACGLGEVSRYLLRYYEPARITGINYSRAQVEHARRNVPGCTFLYMDAVDLAFGDNSFDNVICVEAALHFNTRDRFYREALRVLKPGGRLVTADILARTGSGPNCEVKSTQELAGRLFDAGFDEVVAVDVTRECWHGVRARVRRLPGQARRAGKISLTEYLLGGFITLWANTLSTLNIRYYVLTSARKPTD